MKMQPKPAPTNYKKSGKYALDNLAMALKDYDADKLDKVVGTKDGDSYLAQEWAYVNNIELRQNYIKKIISS